MSRFVAAFPVLCAITNLLAQGAGPPPVQPAVLPADWAERDLEGKWVAYRSAIDANPAVKTMAASWCLALAEQKEWELLEWIALFEGWRNAGTHLAKADAPQVLRVAAWNLGAFDSHDKDTANDLMLRKRREVLGWLAQHPAACHGKVAALQTMLQQQNVEPLDASRYLPPLDPMQFLVPLLDAPAELAEFGDRRSAEPRVRYVHQVLRALSGVLVYGETDDLVVQKVMALTRHAQASVREAAFRTLSKLPGGLVPWPALCKAVGDGSLPAERRELATMALSFSTHPYVFFALHEVAKDLQHPGNLAAIARLGEIGDDTTVACLQGLMTKDAQRLAALADALQKLARRRRAGEHAHPVPMRNLLVRVAWLRETNDSRAGDHAAATAQLLREQMQGNATLPSSIDVFLEWPAPLSPFRGDEAARIEAQVVKFATELRQ